MRRFYIPNLVKSLPEYKLQAYRLALQGDLLLRRFW